ncbi:hypothetical protein CLOACE_22740 [Clostridium acetireducens DSM 10703]|jgi:hypothetical protein|uniref:Uncharacterized protein n=1 Tax=Clostridium acetireducens DSM 10703 TaxID=1121290 RepID=A0A1E8EUY6_9CLOT|nr:hypothetical protein [Clostridium acetireducens]OFH98053.1 hypothetical protein CLOACE_22740 [Clostridium acetireducens DSM 10703]
MFTALILIIIGILLIFLNMKAINKEKHNFQDTLEYKSQYMDEVDFKIGNVRREFAETILEIQQEIEYIKLNYNINDNYIKNDLKKDYNKAIKIYNKIYSESKIEDNEEVSSSENVSSNEKSEINSIKVNEINKMLKEGITVDEIAKKLKIGKGEVLLVKELFLK